MTDISPKVLWSPNADFKENSNLSAFIQWASDKGMPHFNQYEELWTWSVNNLNLFWKLIFEYFNIQYSGNIPQKVFDGDISTAKWFDGVQVSYAEHIMSKYDADEIALWSIREGLEVTPVTWRQLKQEVAGMQAFFKQHNVGKGDRVVGFLPNTRHALVCFLATSSLGAIWSCCSPDFGFEAVRDRFVQIEPKVLIATQGYGYGGKYVDRVDVINEIAESLPTLQAKVAFDLSGNGRIENWTSWDDIEPLDNELKFERVDFNDPLWILFSSGTTGKPKAIVHSQGGCLLEHYKYLSLQADVKEGENFFWYTTTGWMMWNFLQASLLVGAKPVFYDGSPGYPSMMRLWRMADELPIHHFGTSAPFIHACMKKKLKVSDSFDLNALRSIGSTGAPLSPEGFDYVYQHIKSDIWLTSMSGGTDICTAFVGGNPWKPVYQGVIQGRALGCDLHAYDLKNEPSINDVGELVVKQPMPSMPIMFWKDENHARRKSSYFEDIPGVWKHGDWITVDELGGVVIHGRSDATLNRQGVRIGTAEIYRVLDDIDAIADGLIVNYTSKSGADEMPLFVKMADQGALTEQLVKEIKKAIWESNSPRHVPTKIIEVKDIPYTISGKRLEAPVKKLFLGYKLDDVANLGSLRNPEALTAFAELADALLD